MDELNSKALKQPVLPVVNFHEENDFYEGWVCYDPNIKIRVDSWVRLKIPKIPFAVLEQIVAEMRQVAAKSKYDQSELYRAIYYSHAELTYLFHRPKQRAFMGMVWYGQLPPSPPGYSLIGDIHSHADGPAGHSVFDNADELDMPGIYVTLGNLLSSPFPSISCSAIVEGHRVLFWPEQLFEGHPVDQDSEFPQAITVVVPEKSNVDKVFDFLCLGGQNGPH